MTTPTIEPSNVSALVIGIEKYDAGDKYDLNGPANDALKFAAWLLDRGVQPGAIKLFLSSLDQNSGVLTEAEGKGLSPQLATREKISRTITDDFLEQGGQDKLLYVFWSGHGFITKISTTTRRLFFADTNTRNKWNLDFDSLLQAFQTSKRGTVFPQQIFLIDACANPIFRDFYPTIQAEDIGEGFAASGTQGKAEQYALFAAAEYEVATNLANKGMGRFSKAVLEELEEQPLLPNMRVVAQQIKQNFRNKQHLEPVFWAFSIGGGDREGDDNVFQRVKAIEGSNSRLKMSTQDRLQLIETLNALPLAEFEKLLIALNPPPGIVSPSSAQQGIRSPELLRWIEGPTGPGLNELQAVLGQVMVVRQSRIVPQPPAPQPDPVLHNEPKSKLKMPVELNKEEKRLLRAALKHAFPNRAYLAAMLEDELYEDLDSITYQESNYEDAVRELIKWAEARGKLQDLFEGALKVNPGNPKLKELKDLWLRD